MGDTESQGSIPNTYSGKRIKAEVLQVKFKIMKQAVASSPRINLECIGREMVSPLDSKSVVCLVQQSYFNSSIKPKLGPARGLKATPHNFSILKVQMEVTSLLHNILK